MFVCRSSSASCLVKKRAEHTDGNGEGKPQCGEARRDLSPKIVGEGRIVPYVPAQEQIEQTPRRKLYGGNDEGAHKCAEEKREAKKASVSKKNETKAQTAADGH